MDKRAESMKRMLRDKYKMTGETGSYRYMAPEVFRHEAYGPPVDVYAFAVITWEVSEFLSGEGMCPCWGEC